MRGDGGEGGNVERHLEVAREEARVRRGVGESGGRGRGEGRRTENPLEYARVGPSNRDSRASAANLFAPPHHLDFLFLANACCGLRCPHRALCVGDVGEEGDGVVLAASGNFAPGSLAAASPDAAAGQHDGAGGLASLSATPLTRGKEAMADA